MRWHTAPMMPSSRFAIGLAVLLSVPAWLPAPASRAQGPAVQPAWIAVSNRYAQPLLELQARYEPESAARWGVTGLDDQVSQFPVDRPARFKADTQSVIDRLRRQLASEKDAHLAQDLRIMIKSADDMLKDAALSEKYDLPYFNPSQMNFGGIRSLHDDQVPEHRRNAALVRLRTHKAFAEYQVEIDSIASQIAKARGLSATDYRAVIAELKKDQLAGDTILSHYQRRLGDIGAIVRREHLVTLPDRPARIRLATPAETAQQPAPHMVPPPLLNNTGEQGEFVLPLNVPTQPGSADTKRIDDFTFAAASWTLTSHEARPGHELQFAAMVERGVSLARSLFAFNSVNVEGWGLYAEHIMKPYEPLDGQLIALQLHLLRAARAFIDPELQSGRLTPADAMRILTHDVMLSEAFANTEVERYTFQAPGRYSARPRYSRMLQTASRRASRCAWRRQVRDARSEV